MLWSYKSPIRSANTLQDICHFAKIKIKAHLDSRSKLQPIKPWQAVPLTSYFIHCHPSVKCTKDNPAGWTTCENFFEQSGAMLSLAQCKFSINISWENEQLFWNWPFFFPSVVSHRNLPYLSQPDLLGELWANEKHHLKNVRWTAPKGAMPNADITHTYITYT